MNFGELSAIVWPPYMGLATGYPGPPGAVAENEPHDDINYARGQIMWRSEPDGTIVGGVKIFVPKGIYTHVVFFSGPHHVHPLMGANQFEQPLVFDRPGIVEIDPVQNLDVLPRQSA